MAARLRAQGYADYLRSDALVLRCLQRGPLSIGQLAAVLEVSRQAARKVVDGLEDRGYARSERDADDARRLNIALTSDGTAYALAVVGVVRSLNRELERRVDPDQLDAARAVLLEVLAVSSRA